VDPLYAFLRLVGRFWIWFFFKAVEVRHPERVPRGGPVLLCVNHPNNLIDSLLVGAVLPRKVHYLATAALFRNPLLGRFLRAAGVIPVYRRQDDPDKMDRNVETFEACFKALARGQVIAIYPEGTTHAEPRVQRIKTGAARIALEAEARHEGGLGLALLPVGLTFEARKSFRGRVLVAFGEPVEIPPYLRHYREDPRKAVDALTAAIQWAMEAQVIHVERIDVDDVVREVGALYRSDLIRELQAERGLAARQIDVFRLSRAIVDAVQHFKAREPERLERLWQRIQEYKAVLAEYRVRDQAVRSRLEGVGLPRRLGRSGLGLLGLPLFAYGAAVNALPYFLPRWIARAFTRRETDYATARLLSSIVCVPLFWGAEAWLVWRLADLRAAALFLLSLPLSGLFAYRYLGGLDRLGQEGRFGLLALTRTHAARRLLAQRREILDELDRAKRDYLQATRGSSF
jgi:glycerol-3-phosphate O-acyltransferase/dihydroxyacetone phosphate acyltransferase